MPYAFTIIFWFIVTTLAVVPGYALLDSSYLAILVLGEAVFAAALWYRRTAHRARLYAVAAITVVVATVLSPAIAFRQIVFIEPPNPFAYLDGESGSLGGTVNLFDWRYWNSERYERELLAAVPNNRLIKFSQDDQSLRLRGIDAAKCTEAFGTPSRTHSTGELEVWEYYPWTEHPDWTMPVYMKDGKLWRIGD